MIKINWLVMPVPDQVRDDGSGIQYFVLLWLGYKIQNTQNPHNLDHPVKPGDDKVHLDHPVKPGDDK